MESVLEVQNLITRFGAERIHDGVSFAVRRGEMVALIGASGTGKSVLIKEVIGLIRPAAGTIRLFGADVWRSSPEEMNALRRRFGMLFQDGALLLHFPATDDWVAVFLAFQSQAWHTDDITGHRLPQLPDAGPAPRPSPSEPDRLVRIVAALVNPPEAAILAVGRSTQRPYEANGSIVFRPVMTLTLSADHRVTDGATAARFLQDVRAAIEEPYLLL